MRVFGPPGRSGRGRSGCFADVTSYFKVRDASIRVEAAFMVGVHHDPERSRYTKSASG